MLLFLTTNMATVTSRANEEWFATGWGRGGGGGGGGSGQLMGIRLSEVHMGRKLTS